MKLPVLFALGCLVLTVSSHRKHHIRKNGTEGVEAATTHASKPKTTHQMKPIFKRPEVDDLPLKVKKATTNQTVDDFYGQVHTCHTGYEKDHAGVCVDVNECAWRGRNSVCPHGSSCLNTKGSYTCDCGPRREFRHGRCRSTKENRRLKDICFLEYPGQFLDLPATLALAAARIFGPNPFNPGYVSKGNTGIITCKEACRANVHCDAAVVRRSKHSDFHNECFHRLYRTDQDQAPVNSFLHDLRADEDSITFVKAACGSPCEYPGTRPKTEPFAEITAASAAGCAASAAFYPGCTVSVYVTSAHDKDKKENCRLYKNVGAPSADYAYYEDHEESITLVHGICKGVSKFVAKEGKDCCTSYKRSYLPDDKADALYDDNSVLVPAKQFDLATARRDCCAYCKQFHDCTGANLIDGRCLPFANEIKNSYAVFEKLLEKMKSPDEFFEDNSDEHDLSANVEVIVRAKRECSHLYCGYDNFKSNGADPGTLTELGTDQYEDPHARCFALCLQTDGCGHAVTKDYEEPNKCRVTSGVGPVGFRPHEERDNNDFVILAIPNTDGTCSPPLNPYYD